MKTPLKSTVLAFGLLLATSPWPLHADVGQGPDFGLEPRDESASPTPDKPSSLVPDIKIQIDGRNLQLSGTQVETMVAEIMRNLAADNGKAAREMIAGFLESQGGEPPSIKRLLRQLPKVAAEGTGSFELGGEPGIDFEAKAFVVGPDGERKEIEINADEFRLALGLLEQEDTDTSGAIAEDPAPEAEPPLYFIGVAVEPAPEALRGHLGLPEGSGLVVTEAFDGTPAAAAGLRQHDLIVKADGVPQSSHESLVKAVQDAGDDPLELTIFRSGKEEQVTVTPAKRPLPNDTPDPVVPNSPDASEEGLEALREEVREAHELLEKILERLEALESRK